MTKPTADKLRGQIDAGATRDKVAAFDPAAAPLGTDAEAAGFPPQPAELALEQAQVGEAPSQGRRGWGIGYLLVAGIVALGLLAIIALTRATT